MSVTIQRPITVKAIVTDLLKDTLLVELQQALERIEHDLAQLEFQGKKMLLDLEKQGSSQLFSVKQQLAVEREKRLEAKNELLQKMQAVEALELGQEVVHSSVEGIWQVEVGQRWSEILGSEIVLKDDVVVEIREAKSSEQKE